MRRTKGFTLTEIMITVIILAIVTGLAIPGYFNTVEQARLNEAETTLNIIHLGEKIYRLNQGTFWNGGSNATVAAIDAALNIDISTAYYDDIDFSAVSANGYTVRATRNATAGGNTAWFIQYVWNDVTKARTRTSNP